MMFRFSVLFTFLLDLLPCHVLRINLFIFFFRSCSCSFPRQTKRKLEIIPQQNKKKTMLKAPPNPHRAVYLTTRYQKPSSKTTTAKAVVNMVQRAAANSQTHALDALWNSTKGPQMRPGAISCLGDETPTPGSKLGYNIQAGQSNIPGK
jgi:hypothetical protein